MQVGILHWQRRFDRALFLLSRVLMEIWNGLLIGLLIISLLVQSV